MKKFIKLIRIDWLKSLKIIFYKLKYGNRFVYSNIFKVRLNKHSQININGKAKFIIENSFQARRFVQINVNQGNLKVNSLFLNNFSSINCQNSIKIGNDCLFGEGVKLYDHDHQFKLNTQIKNQGFKLGEIVIGDNVWIGSNSIILKDTYIGDNVVIGANSTIKGKIESNTVVYSKRDLVIKRLKVEDCNNEKED